jgi:hypothetical protein
VILGRSPYLVKREDDTPGRQPAPR